MASYTVSALRKDLYKIIDDTSKSHKPVLITGKRNNVVMVSEEDWSAIQETLYLASIPGMTESVREGVETPVKKCSKDLDW